MALHPRPDLGTADLGPSPNLWNKSKWREAQDDPSVGFGLFEDFLGMGIGGTNTYIGNNSAWLFEQYNSTGTFTDAGVERGVVALDSAGQTADDGVQIQLGSNATANLGMFTLAANTQVYYETRVMLTDTPATAQVFFGLASTVTGSDASVLVSGANYSSDHVGFESLETASIKLYCEKAGTRSTTGASGTAIDTWVDGTYAKLGFRINGLSTVDVFVDGVEQKAYQITTGSTTLPTRVLTPKFAVSTGTTTDPILYIDWVRVFKQYSIT